MKRRPIPVVELPRPVHPALENGVFLLTHPSTIMPNRMIDIYFVREFDSSGEPGLRTYWDPGDDRRYGQKLSQLVSIGESCWWSGFRKAYKVAQERGLIEPNKTEAIS